MARNSFAPMPTPITFTFTDEERQAAMEEGERRQRVNEEKGLRGRNNGPRFGKKALNVHLLGAAGAIEGIASILAVRHGIVPPTINFEHADEQIDQRLDLTLNHAKTRTVRAALSNTFGFGGHNASVVFKAHS